MTLLHTTHCWAVSTNFFFCFACIQTSPHRACCKASPKCTLARGFQRFFKVCFSALHFKVSNSVDSLLKCGSSQMLVGWLQTALRRGHSETINLFSGLFYNHTNAMLQSYYTLAEALKLSTKCVLLNLLRRGQ